MMARRIEVARRRRAEGERGAVLVESAIILPLFLLLIFGVIEFSIAFFGQAMVEDAARRGGRVASQLGRSPNYDVEIAKATDEDVAKLPGTMTPIFLFVYRANEEGYPGNPGNRDWVQGLLQCAGVTPQTCSVFAWDDSSKMWGGTSRGHWLDIEWSPNTHEVCPNRDDDEDGEPDGVDRIGVAVGVEYRPLIGMFDGPLRRVDDDRLVRSSVLSFEPGTAAVCGGSGAP